MTRPFSIVSSICMLWSTSAEFLEQLERVMRSQILPTETVWCSCSCELLLFALDDSMITSCRYMGQLMIDAPAARRSRVLSVIAQLMHLQVGCFIFFVFLSSSSSPSSSITCMPIGVLCHVYAPSLFYLELCGCCCSQSYSGQPLLLSWRCRPCLPRWCLSRHAFCL